MTNYIQISKKVASTHRSACDDEICHRHVTEGDVIANTEQFKHIITPELNDAS
jgi:hypothetical protein